MKVIAKVTSSVGTVALLADDGLWHCESNPGLAAWLNVNPATNAREHSGPQWGRFGQCCASVAAANLHGVYEMIGDDPDDPPDAVY